MTRFVLGPTVSSDSPVDPNDRRATDFLWLPRSPATIEYARRVAYHEAGHAVVGLLVGDMPIVEAAIVSSDGLHAVRRESPFENCPDDALPGRMVRAMITSEAGRMVDERRGQRTWQPWLDDMQAVSRFASLVVEPAHHDGMVRHVEGIAREAVYDAMPLIERVADEMLERMSLTGPEVEAIVRYDLPRLGWYYEQAAEALATMVTNSDRSGTSRP